MDTCVCRKYNIVRRRLLIPISRVKVLYLSVIEIKYTLYIINKIDILLRITQYVLYNERDTAITTNTTKTVGIINNTLGI